MHWNSDSPVESILKLLLGVLAIAIAVVAFYEWRHPEKIAEADALPPPTATVARPMQVQPMPAVIQAPSRIVATPTVATPDATMAAPANAMVDALVEPQSSAPVDPEIAARVDAENEARQASWRESREEAIRVQKRLRAENNARRATSDPDAELRCIDGIRFKRLPNGWTQVGEC